MSELDGGRIVARALKEEGITHLFTLCGGHIMPIYEGCLDEGIRIVDVRHEQAAVMAADGWARATQEAGVAAVTAGPGVMNGMTGLANAWKADSPTVVLGGAGDFARRGQGTLQEGPQVEVVRSLTKWSASCERADRLHDMTHTAFRQALTPRTGPTFLELPWDVLFEMGPEPRPARGHRRFKGRVAPDPAALNEAADALANAERPVVLAGHGVWWSRGQDALRGFADRYEAPFYLSSLGRGMLPPRHPHLFVYSRSKALAEADVVLNLGNPLDFRLGFGEGIAEDATFIQADVTGEQMGQNRAFDLGLVGDLGLTLDLLRERLAGRAQPDRKAWFQALREKDEQKHAASAEDRASDATPVNAYRLAREVHDALSEDTMLVADGGNVVALSAKLLQVERPGHWLDPGPYGTLGVGLPFAMAAKLAHPARPVLCLAGDGAFGLNAFEIESLARQDIPVVTVVGNDGAWNQIREPQLNFFGEERAVATGLSQSTRYDRVAEALGGHGERVTDAAEIRPAIERAFASGKPAVVDVVIDRATNKGSGKPM